MKKRLFSLLLAMLMVVTAVTPLVFTANATDGAGETSDEEATLTYEDLYVDGAILVWNAQGKTLTLDEDGNAIIATTAWGSDLKLTKLDSDRASAQIVNGALELIDYKLNGYIYSHDNEGYELSDKAIVGNTYTWTTSLTFQRLDESFYNADATAYGFSANGGAGTADKFTLGSDGYKFFQTAMLATFKDSTRFISKDNLARHDAWAGQYKAAKADATLQADTWMRIHKQDYDALVSNATYGTAVATGTALKAAYAGKMDTLKAAMLEPIPSDHDMNADEVIDGNDIYFARYDAFNHILASVANGGLGRAAYYYRYDVTSAQEPFWKWGMYNTQWRPYGLYNGTLESYDVQGGYKFFTADSAAVPHNDTFVATHTVVASNSYQWTQQYLRNNVTVLNGGVESLSGTTNQSKWNLPQSFLLDGYPARIYSIAVYDSVLTTDEWNQNHFADLCAYYQVDLAKIAEFNKLSDDVKNAFYADYATVSIGDEDISKEFIENSFGNVDRELRLAMYADGAILLWNAKGRFLSLDENGDAIIATTAWGSDLKLTKLDSDRASAQIVDGALEIVDYRLNGLIYAHNNTAYEPFDSKVLNETVSWTTQMTFSRLDGIAPYGANEGVYGFSYGGGVGFYDSTYKDQMILGTKVDNTFYQTIGSNVNKDSNYLISMENLAYHDAWAGQYKAAKADATLQADTWMRIHKQDYDALIANASFGSDAAKTGTELKAAYADNMDALKAAMLDVIPSDYDMNGDSQINGDDIYFARYDAFNYIVASAANGGLGRAVYYQNYNQTSDDIPQLKTGMYRTEVRPMGIYSPATASWNDFLTPTANVVVNDTNMVEYTFKTANAFTSSHWILRDGLGYAGSDVINQSDSRNRYNMVQTFNLSGLPVRIYSFALYNRVLTDLELKQNHFADLANYYEISREAVELYNSLSENALESLLDEYATVTIGTEGVDKASIEAAIKAKVDGELADLMDIEDIIALNGYQISVYTAPAIRAQFWVNLYFEDALEEGVSLKEVGVIASKAGELAVDGLTVLKGEDGVYAVADGMEKTVIYDGTEFIGVVSSDDEGDFATAAVTAADMTAEELQAEYLFRGYAVFEYEGREYVMYADMESDKYADGKVSHYDLAKETAGLYNSDRIVAIVDGAAE